MHRDSRKESISGWAAAEVLTLPNCGKSPKTPIHLFHEPLELPEIWRFVEAPEMHTDKNYDSFLADDFALGVSQQ